jgi:hypothetical protein
VVAGIDYFGQATAGAAAWSDGDRTLTFGDVRRRSERGSWTSASNAGGTSP